MSKFLISIIIGIVAGIIDVIPMIIQKLDKYAITSAFVHWVVLGVIISYIQLPLFPWLKGILVAEITVLPIIIIVLKNDHKAMMPIIIMSAILGALVGISTTKYAN